MGDLKSFSEKIAALAEERSSIEGKMNALLDKEGDLTPEETTQFDQHEKRVKEIDGSIERYKKMEERNKLDAMRNGTPVDHSKQNLSDKDKKDLRKFSFIKFMREAGDLEGKGQRLTGLELEMHQEAQKEARNSGESVQGFGIPSVILHGGRNADPWEKQYEKRDLLADTSSYGAELVPVYKQGFIELLYAKLTVVQLGATRLTGLSGDVDIPRMATGATSSWKTEVDGADESTPTFESMQLRPKRLTTFVDVSKQLLFQGSPDVEMLVKNDLALSVAIALETAAINGSGSAPVPTGILNTSGIGSVAGGDNGLAPTYEHIMKLEEEVAVDNADMGALAYLTNPKVRRKLKITGRQSSGVEGNFIWVPNSDQLNGYAAGVSTLVPSTLSKGTSTGVCSAIIFGNWRELVIAQWAGLDIMVNPYTKAKTAQVEVIVHAWHDIGVRHAASFAAMKDALTT